MKSQYTVDDKPLLETEQRFAKAIKRLQQEMSDEIDREIIATLIKKSKERRNPED